jgi:hypothetical protein
MLKNTKNQKLHHHKKANLSPNKKNNNIFGLDAKVQIFKNFSSNRQICQSYSHWN